MRTTADERLDDAGRNVKEAVLALHAVLIEECGGHDEYRDDYKAVLFEVHRELIDIKRRLNR